MEEFIFTFENTSSAIQAEQILLEANLPVKVMPLPSAVRAGCGIALRLAPEHLQQGKKLLTQKQAANFTIYLRKNQNNTSTYEVVEA